MPLDPSVVAMLERVGGSAFVERLIAIFLEQTPGRLREIRRGVERQDLGHVAHWAHSVRSSSVSLGIRGLSDYAEQLESQALDGDPADMGVLVERLEHSFERCRSELEEWSGDGDEADDSHR